MRKGSSEYTKKQKKKVKESARDVCVNKQKRRNKGTKGKDSICKRERET